MAAKIFRINYKSDFILTLESDAGWMTPFCIKFWTGAPSQAFFAGWDGTTYTHCSYDPSEPTKLVVQFDDHHLPIGDLKLQIAYHFTVADFPNDTEDEVINPADITTLIDGQEYQVMLDFTGETAPEIQFSLPAYANEAQRIENEQQRIENEQQRIANEQERIDNEQTRQRNEGTRIENEQQRVQEFGQMKGELEQATRDAAAAAENANEKGVYAKNQGDYAKQQGDYAKQQGDIAQADHERAEEDHRIAGEDHTQAGSDHTRAGEDHTQAGSDHTRAGEDHTRAGDDHTRADQDHTRAESDHAAVELYVDSLGAFDISAYHSTGGVLATYANLQAALGTNGANIPESMRKGGMSVKFVQGSAQSSDNKYVQFRYLLEYANTTAGNAAFVNPANWQGVDDKPISGSHNCVKGGGIDEYALNLVYDNLRNYQFGRGDLKKIVYSSSTQTYQALDNFGSIIVPIRKKDTISALTYSASPLLSVYVDANEPVIDGERNILDDTPLNYVNETNNTVWLIVSFQTNNDTLIECSVSINKHNDIADVEKSVDDLTQNLLTSLDRSEIVTGSLPFVFERGSINTSTGIPYNSTVGLRTGFIEVVASSALKIFNPKGLNIIIFKYEADEDYLSRDSLSGTEFNYTVPAGVGLVRVMLYKQDVSTINIQEAGGFSIITDNSYLGNRINHLAQKEAEDIAGVENEMLDITGLKENNEYDNDDLTTLVYNSSAHEYRNMDGFRSLVLMVGINEFINWSYTTSVTGSLLYCYVDSVKPEVGSERTANYIDVSSLSEYVNNTTQVMWFTIAFRYENTPTISILVTKIHYGKYGLSENKWLGKKLLCLGDSITDMGHYVKPLADILGTITYNRGWSNTCLTKTEGGTSAGKKSIAERVDETPNDSLVDSADVHHSGYPTSADIVTIFAGVNDWYYLGSDGYNIPVGNVTDAPDVDASFCGAMHYLMQRLKERYGLARIIVILVHRVKSYRFTPASEINFIDDGVAGKTQAEIEASGFNFITKRDTNTTLDDLRNCMAEIATMYGAEVVDLRKVGFSFFWDDDREEYSTLNSGQYDGLHPNAAGGKLISEYIAKHILNT